MTDETQAENCPITIGPYQILKQIGSGGMGEVFLAYDPICHRKVAIKRMRSDKDTEKHEKYREQFLKEALLTAQLTHPSIVPIYSIVDEKDLLYFTMPYIEGLTLKALFAQARDSEEKGEKPNPLSTVTTLSYAFLQICRAIEYAHSQGVIHRDLKPSNIMLGPLGEVRILDWGLVQEISDLKQLAFEEAGKIAGSLMYLAPEIILGDSPSPQSEVYSLGLILYQMLTLRYPFHREQIKEYRESLDKDILVDPLTVAPYRDIHPILSKIVMKCLITSPKERYQTVNELIYDLESYLEMRSQWIKLAELDLLDDSGWEWQKGIEISAEKKANFCLSKQAFVGNISIEANIWIGETGLGIGFSPGIPINLEGNCIWLASASHLPSMVFCLNEKLLEAKETILNKNQWNKVRIDRIKSNLYIYVNDIFRFSFINYIPPKGHHIGFVAIDEDYKINNFSIYVDAKNLHENPLAVGNAFFANREFSKALEAYRDAASLFRTTSESFEAIFQTGLVLLEEARNVNIPAKRASHLEEVLHEFNKLHGTSAGPLELLGKLLVYRLQNDFPGEWETFESAFQRFSHHFLIYRIKDQLIYRLFESTYGLESEFYTLALLAIRYLPAPLIAPILEILKTRLKSLHFVQDANSAKWPDSLKATILGIEIAFFMGNHQFIEQIMHDILKMPLTPLQVIETGLFALIELGQQEAALQIIDMMFQKILDVQAIARLEKIKLNILKR